MKKILVVTKNHPVEVTSVIKDIYESVATLNQRIFVGGPQFTAWQVSEMKNINYLDLYYPAIRAYKNIENLATEDVDIAIIVGTGDIKDFFNYDAVVGINNKEVQDYTNFPEEMNHTNIETIKLSNCEIKFNNMNELLHFLRIVINNFYRKGEDNE